MGLVGRKEVEELIFFSLQTVPSTLFNLILEPVLYVYCGNYGLICLKFTALFWTVCISRCCGLSCRIKDPVLHLASQVSFSPLAHKYIPYNYMRVLLILGIMFLIVLIDFQFSIILSFYSPFRVSSWWNAEFHWFCWNRPAE